MSSFPGSSSDDIVYRARVSDEAIEADVRRVLDRADKAFTAANQLTRKSLGGGVPNELTDQQIEGIVRRSTERQYRAAEQAADRARRQTESNASRFQRSSDAADFSRFRQGERDAAGREESDIQREADRLYRERQAARRRASGGGEDEAGGGSGAERVEGRRYILRAAEAAARGGLAYAEFNRRYQRHEGDAGAQAEDQQRYSQELVSAGNSVYGAGTIGQMLRRNLDPTYKADEAYIDDTERAERRREVRLQQIQQHAEAMRRGNEELLRRSRANQTAGLSRKEQEAADVGEERRDLGEFVSNLGPADASRPEVRDAIARARQGIATREAAGFRASTFRDMQGVYGLRALQARNAGDFAGAREQDFRADLDRQKEAARAESPEALRRFTDEGQPAARKSFEDQQRRDRERAEAESAARVRDSVNNIDVAAMRQRGERYAADVTEFAHAWDEKLQRARLAVSQEADLEERGRRQRELSVLEREREAEVAQFAERRKRREADETNQHMARLGESQSRAAGRNYEADERAFDASWQHRVDTAEDDTRRLDAAQEWYEARAARRHQQARRAQDVLNEATYTTLRASGRSGVADILSIKTEADKAYAEAAGNPQMQQAIRAKEAADLRALDRRLSDRGTAESVGGPNRVDFRNRLSGSLSPEKDSAAVLRDLIAKILMQIAKNTSIPPIGVTK